MMESYVLKGVALCMCYLTVSIIFITAHAMRVDAVFQANVYGQDNLDNLRRMNDTTTISALADSDLVNIIGSSGSLNMSCTSNDDGTSTCVYTFPQTYQSPGTYTVNLAQIGGTPPSTSTSYMVDGEAPSFSRADISQLGSSVTATYDIRDTAGPSTGGCSGLDQLRLVVDENTIATEELNGSCAASGVLTGSAPGIDGRVGMYLLVTDRLGNTGRSDMKTKSIDTVPPVLPSTFQLLRNGVDVEQMSTDTAADIRVELRFTITESSLRNVVVNASSLTTDASLASGYAHLTPSCTPQGNVNVCSVPNLRLSPASEDLDIVITATDQAGNSVDGHAYKSLEIENSKPTITYLGRGDHCDTCFLRQGENDLLAVVNAPGGLNGAGLFFNLDGRHVATKNCTDTGSAWECTATAFVNSAVNGKHLKLEVEPRSMDDLGNSFTGVLSKEFTLDNEKPRIVEQPKADAACPVAGQTLTVRAKASDKYSPALWIWANASAVTDRGVIEQKCEPLGDGQFSCTLPIDSFLSTHTEASVPLEIRDAAGNAIKLAMQLEVCEAELEATPNYIKKMVPSGTLPLVNKRLASLIPFRVLLPLSLQMVGRAKAIQVTSVRCQTPQVVGPSYVMNEFSSSPLLVTSFQYDGVWPNSTLDLNCTLDFTIRRGNVVYVKPESEPLNVQLPLIGQEIGNPDQAVRDKMNGLATEINQLQKQIKSKDGLDDSLGQICSMVENIAMINNGLAAVKAVLYSLSLALAPFGVGAGIWAGAEQSIDTFNADISTYLWPPGWIPTGLGTQAIGYVIKYTCAIYTCKIYDMDEWVSFVMELGSKFNFYQAAMAPPKGMAILPGASIQNGYLVDKDGNRLIVTYDSKGNPEIKVRSTKYEQVRAIVDYSYSLEVRLYHYPLVPYYTYSPINAIPLQNIYSNPSDYMVNTKNGEVRQDENFKELKKTKKFKARNWMSLTDMQTQQRGIINGAVDQFENTNWVVNPYENQPYDGLCLPAQLYNLRKDKMLKCKELKCIDQLSQQGLPITSCEQIYSTQHCLYVEGADYRRNGGDLFEKLVDALPQIVLSAAIGLGLNLLFVWACPGLYFSIAHPESLIVKKGSCTLPGARETNQVNWKTLPCGATAVGCGFFGLALYLPEILDMIHNPWNSWSTVPASEDYCEGLEAWNITGDTSA